MTLQRLRLQGFRNLEDATLELPPEGVALVGANAQGKSNFLEAIHYLEIFRSCRGTRDTRLIRFGEDFFRLEGRLAPPVSPDSGDHARPRSVAAAVQRAGPVKKVTVDGEEPPRIGDALGEMGSVLFTPDDVRLVADGPQERRRFLDIVLSVNAPGYLEALQRYRQVLAQRNAALRDRAPRAGVEAWDPLLAGAGATVLRMRAAWIRAGAPSFRSVVEEVSGGERGVLVYRPGVPGGGASAGSSGPIVASKGGPGKAGGSEEADGAGVRDEPDRLDMPNRPDPRDASEAALLDGPWGEWFAGALREGLEADRRRGTTLVGPHRDEFTMGLEPDGEDPVTKGGRDLREYGSGGQKRTAALALRILEAETVLRRRGRPALLLLDDVFAELDAERSERVLGLLDRTAAGQVVLTAPKDADVRFRHDRLPRWRISAGRIETGGRDG